MKKLTKTEYPSQVFSYQTDYQTAELWKFSEKQMAYHEHAVTVPVLRSTPQKASTRAANWPRAVGTCSQQPAWARMHGLCLEGWGLHGPLSLLWTGTSRPGLFLQRTSWRQEPLDGRYRISPARMQLLVAGGRQGFEWILLDNRSFLKVVTEDKGEEEQMEIQKLQDPSSVCHSPLRVLEGPSFLAHELSGYLCSLMTNLCKF